MLSILIPVFNQDVRRLAYTLATQCNKLNINYQILCFDDGSEEKYKLKNKELAFKMNINYTELPQNLGRSKIRNWLGKSAYFEYLLFLDGDSGVRDKNFIKKYLDHLPYEGVLYGGRTYQKKKPAKSNKVLHWKYGMTREALSAKKRNKKPYLNFQSNNFLVPSKVFENIHFLENIEGYGYEDLQYAHLLETKGIQIKHIDNPVFHDGLENNKHFLQKTKNSINNLVTLEAKKQVSITRLQDFHQTMMDYGLDAWLYNILTRYKEPLEAHLLSANPSIKLFNLWKWMLYVTKKNSLTRR